MNEIAEVIFYDDEKLVQNRVKSVKILFSRNVCQIQLVESLLGALTAGRGENDRSGE